MLVRFNIYTLTSLFLLMLSSCGNNASNKVIDASLPQLQRLSSEETNVHFVNKVEVSANNTMLTNNSLHAGGGISVGDINNDGLQDFVIISNQDAPGVYLNKGDFEFENISKSSGLTKTKGWSTGVVMEDVNSDGYVDIYISKGIYQHKDPTDRVNRLYINNKDNTFTERAEEFGIASTNATIQSVFFDYDLDGDLDLYLLNQPVDSDTLMVSVLGQRRMNTTDPKNSDILYRNDGNVFRNVSQGMGITNGVMV